jgi:hypothetical protein
MARPKKEKLDYYPKDTDQLSNRKIRRLLSDYGANGYLIYEYILQLIYGGKGYFLMADENLAFDISDYLPSEINESMVNSTIKSCLEYGLFDKEKYENFQVLTNETIQKNYYLAYRGNKNLLQKIIINVAETPVNVTQTLVNVAQNKLFDEKEHINASYCNNNNFDPSKTPKNDNKTEDNFVISKIVNSAQTQVNETITPINATQTPVIDVESAENRGEMPQKKRKENKRKEIKRKGKEKNKKIPPDKFDEKTKNFKRRNSDNEEQFVEENINEEKEKNSAQKEKENFENCKRYFQEKNGSYIWEANDDYQLSELLTKIKITLARDKLPIEPNQAFKDFLDNLPIFWQKRRFSMQNLNKNYNEILNEIRQNTNDYNGKQREQQRKFGRHTTEELTDFAKNFGK